MRKLFVLVCVLTSALSAFAFMGSGAMVGFMLIPLFLVLALFVLCIVMIVKFFEMAKNIKLISEHVVKVNPRLTYLLAIGEEEQAHKAAVKMLVDKLYPIYQNKYVLNKAQEMNKAIGSTLDKIRILGIALPDHVTSGEKFIN